MDQPVKHLVTRGNATSEVFCIDTPNFYFLTKVFVLLMAGQKIMSCCKAVARAKAIVVLGHANQLLIIFLQRVTLN